MRLEYFAYNLNIEMYTFFTFAKHTFVLILKEKKNINI